MDYDSIDRDMSSWVVTCEKNGTRFYLTRDKYASDDFGRAYRHRYHQIADAVADQERRDTLASGHPVWDGFDWQVMSVPEALGMTIHHRQEIQALGRKSHLGMGPDCSVCGKPFYGPHDHRALAND